MTVNNKEFFEFGSDGFYGHVDGDRPKDKRSAIDADPFEALLSLCRMMGLHYRVTQEGDKWYCRVGSQNFPGDFHGSHTREKVFGVCNCDDRQFGLMSAMSMAFNCLRADCDVWRDMVTKTDDYKSWFKQPKE